MVVRHCLRRCLRRCLRCCLLRSRLRLRCRFRDVFGLPELPRRPPGARLCRKIRHVQSVSVQYLGLRAARGAAHEAQVLRRLAARRGEPCEDEPPHAVPDRRLVVSVAGGVRHTRGAVRHVESVLFRRLLRLLHIPSAHLAVAGCSSPSVPTACSPSSPSNRVWDPRGARKLARAKWPLRGPERKATAWTPAGAVASRFTPRRAPPPCLPYAVGAHAQSFVKLVCPVFFLSGSLSGLGVKREGAT